MLIVSCLKLYAFFLIKMTVIHENIVRISKKRRSNILMQNTIQVQLNCLGSEFLLFKKETVIIYEN